MYKGILPKINLVSIISELKILNNLIEKKSKEIYVYIIICIYKKDFLIKIINYLNIGEPSSKSK